MGWGYPCLTFCFEDGFFRSMFVNYNLLTILRKALSDKLGFSSDSVSSSFQLKVLSSTFLLVCFVCLKGSTFETKKNVFHFISKAFFVLEIIRF